MRAARSAALVGALVLAAGVLAGCGGGTTESFSPGPADPVSSTTPGAALGTLTRLKADGYTVRLPGTATRREQDVPTKLGNTHVVLYSAPAPNGNVFVVGLTEFPNTAVAIKNGLDGAIPGAAATIGGTVRDVRTLTFKGHQAREGRYIGSGGGIDLTVFALVAEVDNKLFQLQYVVRGKDLTVKPPEFDQIASTVAFG
ncbi:MAG: hypothetical protein ACJ72D_11475 [Marmoricola sp.]